MPPPLDQQLLSRLHVSRVRSDDEFLILTKRQDVAAGMGTLGYRVRDLDRLREIGSKQPIAIMGNASVGSGSFAYVYDRLGKETTFLQPHRISLCFSHILQGSAQVRPYRGQPSLATAGEMLLMQGQVGTQVETSDDSLRMNLWFDGERLAARLEAMLDQRLTVPLSFKPMQQGSGGINQSLQRLIGYVAAEIADPESFLARGVGVGVFEEFAAHAVLEGVAHNYSELLHARRPSATSRAVRQAEAFMRAHLAGPLRVEDIASAAGCSARALLTAFRKERGQTIVSLLRDLRLDAARRDLMAAGPSVAASHVALRYGFSNPGRFSTAYERRFGEKPSDTAGRVASFRVAGLRGSKLGLG